MRQRALQYGQRYPGHVDDFVDVERLLEEQLFRGYAPENPLLRPNDGIVTLGSCFAANVAEALGQRGLRVRVNRFHEEANSPLANALLLDYLVHGERSEARASFESYVALDEAEAFLAPIRDARCLIFTVGVGITAFDRVTGRLVLRPNETDVRRLSWEFPEPAEQARHLRAFVDAVRALNPDIHVVLTLSPVPLYRAITTPSAFVEDAVSKGHLRVALHQLFQDDPRPNTHYWPSFEAFRWVGPHLGPVFGEDDQNPRHASAWMVDLVARAFVRHFVAVGDAVGPALPSGCSERQVVPLDRMPLDHKPVGEPGR